MARLPEHIRLMLGRRAQDPHLVLTAPCGCEVGTVIYRGEEMPYVDVCRDHRDDVLSATEFVEKVEDPPQSPKRRREDLN